MFLGAFASGIGVYVLTNTDTRAFARTLFFAALCGFAWKPVCDAGAAFVEQAVQQRQDATAQELGDQVAQLSTNLTDTPSPQLDLKLEEISGAAQAAVEALPQVRNPKIRREIEAKINVALQAVSQVAPQKPQTASRVLQNVGESAARNQAANVSVAAMSSLDRLSPTNQAFAVARTQMQTNVANTITRRYQLDRLIHR